MLYEEIEVELQKISSVIKDIEQLLLSDCSIGEIENILFGLYEKGYEKGFQDNSEHVATSKIIENN